MKFVPGVFCDLSVNGGDYRAVMLIRSDINVNIIDNSGTVCGKWTRQSYLYLRDAISRKEFESVISTSNYTIHKNTPIEFRDDVVHKMGNRYIRNSGGEYILAQIDRKKMALINLHSGNRHTDGVEVVDTDNVTNYEWEDMWGSGEFTLKTVD